jgi:hypothetical protein
MASLQAGKDRVIVVDLDSPHRDKTGLVIAVLAPHRPYPVKVELDAPEGEEKPIAYFKHHQVEKVEASELPKEEAPIARSTEEEDD